MNSSNVNHHDYAKMKKRGGSIKAHTIIAAGIVACYIFNMLLSSVSVTNFDVVLEALLDVNVTKRSLQRQTKTKLSFDDQNNDNDTNNNNNIIHNNIINMTSSNTRPTKIDSVDNIMVVPIIVQLSGELGNHLSKIAFANALQWQAKNEYGIQTKLVFRHFYKDYKNWQRPIQEIKQCFPKLRKINFGRGNSKQYQELLHESKKSYNAKKKTMNNQIILSERPTPLQIQQQLQTLQRELLKKTNNSNQNHHYDNEKNLSSPFIYVSSMIRNDQIDTYYHELRDLFQFDDAKCCNQLPYADESVFHFRNFIGEMSQMANIRGLQEVSPNQTVNDLFGHLQSHDKVAIVSRFNNKYVKQYVKAFQQEKNLTKVRVIHNNTGVQDFCFLKQTKKEVAGFFRSTFVKWAVLLGNVTKANLYSIDTPQAREFFGADKFFKIKFNFTKTPELQARIHYRMLSQEKEQQQER